MGPVAVDRPRNAFHILPPFVARQEAAGLRHPRAPRARPLGRGGVPLSPVPDSPGRRNVHVCILHGARPAKFVHVRRGGVQVIKLVMRSIEPRRLVLEEKWRRRVPIDTWMVLSMMTMYGFFTSAHGTQNSMLFPFREIFQGERLRPETVS